jgi:hypothetical protein
VSIFSPINLENSLYGVAIYGEDVLISSTSATDDAIYYTPIFKKNSYELWDKVIWEDNTYRNTLLPECFAGGPTPCKTKFGTTQIEVRVRTGNALPTKNYSTRTNYTIDEMNTIIKYQSREYVDSLMWRSCMGRAVTSQLPAYLQPTPSVPSTPPFSLSNGLGTALNTFRLWDGQDALWTYWSHPIIYSPSYIPPNKDFDYIQARITLKSLDGTAIPEVYRINFASILKDPC